MKIKVRFHDGRYITLKDIGSVMMRNSDQTISFFADEASEDKGIEAAVFNMSAISGWWIAEYEYRTPVLAE